MHFFTCVSIVLLSVATCKADYNDFQKETITMNAEICKKELDIPAESKIQQMAMYGDLSRDDKKSKQYYSCMMLKMGFMEQDGAINGPEIVEFMAPQYSRDAVTTVVESCMHPEGKLIQDKAYAFAQCFFAKKSFEI